MKLKKKKERFWAPRKREQVKGLRRPWGGTTGTNALSGGTKEPSLVSRAYFSVVVVDGMQGVRILIGRAAPLLVGDQLQISKRVLRGPRLKALCLPRASGLSYWSG